MSFWAIIQNLGILIAAILGVKEIVRWIRGRQVRISGKYQVSSYPLPQFIRTKLREEATGDANDLRLYFTHYPVPFLELVSGSLTNTGERFADDVEIRSRAAVLFELEDERNGLRAFENTSVASIGRLQVGETIGFKIWREGGNKKGVTKKGSNQNV